MQLCSREINKPAQVKPFARDRSYLVGSMAIENDASSKVIIIHVCNAQISLCCSKRGCTFCCIYVPSFLVFLLFVSYMSFVMFLLACSRECMDSKLANFSAEW